MIEYESMSLIRMKYDALIALVEYDYDAAMLERKYLIQKTDTITIRNSTTSLYFSIQFRKGTTDSFGMETKYVDTTYTQRIIFKYVIDDHDN